MTPFSEELRRDLRNTEPRLVGIAINIITSLIRSIAFDPHPIVTSVPMASGSKSRDHFFEATSAAASNCDLKAERLVLRRKRRSTKSNVRQVRRSIVQNEYHINSELAPKIQGSTIILIDDNVTTGETMIGVSNLLEAQGALSVFTLSLDRTISPRLRQVLLEEKPIMCPHKINGSGPAISELQ